MLKIGNFNKIIIANWKLNGSLAFVEKFYNKIKLNKEKDPGSCIIICPPYTLINKIRSEYFFTGAQDCSIYSEGPYTGDISAKMLRDLGCKFCIIGHSERRSHSGDTDEIINNKILRCLENDIIPILCVGESLDQKNQNRTKDILTNQIQKCIPKNATKNNLIIAYEPLWAIGTGLTPKLEEISSIHLFIKNNIPKSKNYKILYGGSVKSNNSKLIMNLEGVDGILIGGSSINLEEFKQIIKS